MRHQKFIIGYFGFLNTHYPIPKGVRLDVVYHQPEDFPQHPRYKHADGFCRRVDSAYYHIDVKISKHRIITAFRLGHEYKHVLQWCYEGMRADDEQIRGLGYVYKMWEIPANYFANETIDAFKASLSQTYSSKLAT